MITCKSWQILRSSKGEALISIAYGNAIR